MASGGDELVLAVANPAETFERIRTPLAERGVRARPLDWKGRVVDRADPPWDAVDVGFVYPGRFVEGGVLDAALDVSWVNDREAVATSRNKAGVYAALSRAGVPTPETAFVSNPTDEQAVGKAFERFDGEAVVKPTSTTRGTGVVRVADPDSFLGVTDYLDLLHDYRATADKSYLIQEYLAGARDYRVMVVDGDYAGAVERRLPDAARERGRWKHNVHRGAEARGVDLDADLRRLAERAAAVLDIDLLGVDLLVTDERAVVNETNARPTVDDAEKYEADFYDRLEDLIRRTA